MTPDQETSTQIDEQPEETRAKTIPDTTSHVFLGGDEYLLEGIPEAIEAFIKTAALDEAEKNQAREWCRQQMERMLKRRSPEQRDQNFISSVTNNVVGQLEFFVRQMIESKTKRQERLNPFLHTKPETKQLVEKFFVENKESGKKNNFVVLVNIDLDDFKQVNDQFDHLTGDKLLQSFGRALAASVRPDDDFAAHYSGDEFGLVFRINLPEETKPEDVDKKIQEILQRTIAHAQNLTECPNKKQGEKKLQEISAGYKIISIDDEGNFEQFHGEADKASETSKIIRILIEAKNEKIASAARIVNHQDIDKIMAEYTPREVAMARAMRGLKRELNRLAADMPDTMHDVDLPQKVREFFGELMPKE